MQLRGQVIEVFFCAPSPLSRRQWRHVCELRQAGGIPPPRASCGYRHPRGAIAGLKGNKEFLNLNLLMMVVMVTVMIKIVVIMVLMIMMIVVEATIMTTITLLVLVMLLLFLRITMTSFIIYDSADRVVIVVDIIIIMMRILQFNLRTCSI